MDFADVHECTHGCRWLRFHTAILTQDQRVCNELVESNFNRQSGRLSQGLDEYSVGLSHLVSRVIEL